MERDIHKILRKENLALPIPITYEVIDESAGEPGETRKAKQARTIPVLRFSDTVRYLVESGNFNKLLGELPLEDAGPILRSHWKRWVVMHPYHLVTKRIASGEYLPERLLPVNMHQDEGRGLGRNAVLCINTQGVIGQGSRMSKINLEKRCGPNFGQSLRSRFLYTALPKFYYDRVPEKFRAVFQKYVDDLKILTDTGFQGPDGHVWHIAFMHAKADWPAHCSQGSLTRSFRNVCKNPHAKTKPKPICHLCQAGREDYPFEETGPDASWTSTIGDGPLPWKAGTETPLLQLGHDEANPPAIMAPDFWHNWHAGEGKGWIGSTCVLSLPLFEQSSVEKALCALNEDVHAYCTREKVRVQCLPITREKLDWKSFQKYPSLHYQKGQDCNVLVDWICDFYKRQQADPSSAYHTDNLYRLIHRGTLAMSNFCRMAYSQPLWIPREQGQAMADQGWAFLDAHRRLVSMCYSRGLNRYMMQPKLHLISHTIHQLQLETSLYGYCSNFLSESCQMCEDFIGHVCRISRRVSPRLTALRTINRYLVRARQVWTDTADSKVRKRKV